MVKLRESHPVLPDGSIDIESWVQRFSGKHFEDNIETLKKASQCILSCEKSLPSGERNLHAALHVAELLYELGVDLQTVTTAMLYFPYQEEKITIEQIQHQFGDASSKLIEQLNKLDQLKLSTVSQTNKLEHQLQNLRKMLLAVVQDMRVVFIKLAEHLVELRFVVKTSGDYKQQLAHLTNEIYAPLANRLGIGQIKWELEDLSFRILEPTVYKNIAKLLDEKRGDREKYIQNVIHLITESLQAENIQAHISGRVKHIYSIWRKMQHKGVSYHEIYDVRAIRVIVPKLSDCYGSLGIVHTLWQHIPKEFDDYIANPKSNGYRSLHTAVIGPEGKVLEVQIRTQEMHDQAELGVAAHWRYKEGSNFEPSYNEKLKGLRQLLNWQEELVTEKESAEALQTEFFGDRVYVFSPNGEVFDLPQGATPIDFAYSVHTEVGHRCRGAKINGKMVPLAYRLASGEQVEILTARDGGPSRDWLNNELKYTVTSRARAKIHQWFKHQDREQNIHDGRDMLSRELRRLGLGKVNTSELASQIANCSTDEDLLAGLGSGDIRLSQVLGALQRLQPKQPKDEALGSLRTIQKTKSVKAAEITVEGIGDMMCHMARCCRPVPGDQIIGYITIGEGVSVHRSDCINILQAKERKQNRLISVAWGNETKNSYVVKVKIEAYQRRDLLKDLTSVFSAEKVDLHHIESHNSQKDSMVTFTLNLEVTGIEMLGRVLMRLQQIPNVTDAYRISE